MADIFISYSSHDRAKASALCLKLRDAGMSVWIDESGISAASQWTKEIVRAIGECKVFIILLSRSALGSHNVIKELTLASEEKKHIIPVELETVELIEEVKYQLAGIQRVSYKETERIIQAAAHFLDIPVSSATSPGKKKFNWKMAFPVVGLLLAIVLFYKIMNPKQELILKDKSIVLLPFTSPANDTATMQLAAGFSDELTSKIESAGELLVAGYQTAKEYLHQSISPKQIAGELHVGYVFRGDLKAESDGISLTTHLIDGSTGDDVWSKTYTISEGKLPILKDSIANEVLHQFGVRPITSNVIQKKIDPDAYRIFIRAKAALDTDLCNAAIKLDSNFGAPYALKGEILANKEGRSGKMTPDKFNRIRNLVMKGLLLDPKSGEIYRQLAIVYLQHNQYDDYRAALLTAVSLSPFNAQVLMSYADALSLIRDRHAIEYTEKAVRLDPTGISTMKEAFLVFDRLYDTVRLREAALKFEPLYTRYYRSNPNDLGTTMFYVQSLIFRGDSSKVRSLLEEVQKKNNDKDILTTYDIACSYSRIGDRKHALITLERVFKVLPAEKEFAKNDRDFDGMKDDPEFRKLVGLK